MAAFSIARWMPPGMHRTERSWIGRMIILSHKEREKLWRTANVPVVYSTIHAIFDNSCLAAPWSHSRNHISRSLHPSRHNRWLFSFTICTQCILLPLPPATSKMLWHVRWRSRGFPRVSRVGVFLPSLAFLLCMMISQNKWEEGGIDIVPFLCQKVTRSFVSQTSILEWT